jgi:hypothetical protein
MYHTACNHWYKYLPFTHKTRDILQTRNFLIGLVIIQRLLEELDHTAIVILCRAFPMVPGVTALVLSSRQTSQ